MTTGGGVEVADVRIPWPVSAVLAAVAETRDRPTEQPMSCPFLLCFEDATVWFGVRGAAMTNTLRCCPEHKRYLEGRLRIRSVIPLPTESDEAPPVAGPGPAPVHQDPGQPTLGEPA
jgi:hypothetical protein